MKFKHNLNELSRFHPSGDSQPSPQDIETTKRLVESGNVLGIKVLDHIIIGDGNYFSFKENSLI